MREKGPARLRFFPMSRQKRPTVHTQDKRVSNMGFLKAIISLVLFAIIAVSAYWLVASYTTKGDLPYWAEINQVLPDPLRSFACANIKKADASATAPSCEGF